MSKRCGESLPLPRVTRKRPGSSRHYVGFNTHHGPLADRRLRERIVQTLDVPRLVRQAIGRLAIPATSLIPPGLLGRDPMSVSRLERTPSARPDRLPEPIDLTAAVNPIFFAGYATLAREVTQALGQTGVRIRIGNKTIAELTDAQSHGKVDVVLARWVADYPDPDTFANLLHSKHGLYGRMGGTPELDRIIERARAETASATRHALYRQLEDTISRDALLLPLFHEQGYRFARPEVEGLSVNFMQPTVAFEELRIRSEGGGR